MNAQFKKGIIDICVLAALSKDDSYAYKIFSELPKELQISESTIYGVLKRMSSVNMITMYSVSHNGRLRRYCKITNAGIKVVKDYIAEMDKAAKIHEFIIKNFI